ncbi:MAG: SMI1/KNR4 family protein [Deltaproteobacteria bacterium]|nr:SMI1/KNR4 family protein [Deltaproteobacteria bacterium]
MRPPPDLHRRVDRARVEACLERLGVEVPRDFRDFYLRYEGAFGSSATGFELLDLCERSPSIESSTNEVHQVHGWPARYLVLTTYVGNGVLVLDCETASVFDVDFEGSDRELLQGKLAPRWKSFGDFLEFFFAA